MEQKNYLRLLKEYLLIFVGTIFMGIGINQFFRPNGLVVGGFSGLGIIIQSYTMDLFGFQVQLWLTNAMLNLPLFLVAAKVLGVKGLGRTLFATVSLSVSLFLMSCLPELSVRDNLLAALFGGVFEGVGLGIIFRYSATTGGSDLVSAIIRKFNKHLSMSKLMFIIDTGIIIIGLFTFGIEKAMYAIIAAFIVSKVISTVLEGVSFAKAAFIISDYTEEIADKLLTELDRGVTGLYGRGMFTKKDKNVVLCVVSTKELIRVKEIISHIDSKAFVIVADVREVLGEGFEPI